MERIESLVFLVSVFASGPAAVGAKRRRCTSPNRLWDKYRIPYNYPHIFGLLVYDASYWAWSYAEFLDNSGWRELDVDLRSTLPPLYRRRQHYTLSPFLALALPHRRTEGWRGIDNYSSLGMTLIACAVQP